MAPVRIRLRTWILNSAAILLCLGCAQNASLVHLRPAPANVAAVRGMAVLNVRAVRGLGSATTERLQSELAAGQSCRLVNQEGLQQFAPAPLQFQDGSPNVPAALEAARQAGLDAVLVANMRIKESNGTDYGTTTLRIGDPVVAAVFNYQLYDVHRGELLDQNVVRSSYYSGELTRIGDGDHSESQVFQRLAEEGATELARQLTPHEAEVDVQLATGGFSPLGWRLNRGNVTANRGDWEGAAEHWQSVLEDDPEHDAALYNLGAASEASRDFDRATRFYEAAIHLADRPLYRDALQRVRRAAFEYRDAVVQRSWSERDESAPQLAQASRAPLSDPQPSLPAQGGDSHWQRPQPLPPVSVSR